MIGELFIGENKYLEYKQIYTKNLLKTVSAFANYHDGIIVIGITDSIKVLGVKKPDEVRLKIENAINDNIEPKPLYEIEKKSYKDKIIILLKVYKGDYTPYTYKNKAYKRMDTSTVETDRHSYEELILQGRNLSFEDLEAKDQNLSFNYFERKLKKILGIKNLSEDLLITLKLKNNGKYNNTAALLSDDNYFQSSTIHLVKYIDNSLNNIEDKRSLEGISNIEQFDLCLQFCEKHINIEEKIEGAYRKTYEEIPIIALREAIANMIVHRDYSKDREARIEIFKDNISIVSPGGLPIGISEEEYIEGKISVPRNRILADIFQRLKIIERLATGIRRIKESYKDFVMKPEFDVTENTITVILPKTRNYIDNKEIDNKKNLDNFSKIEKQIYNIIIEFQPISRAKIQEKIGLSKSQTIEYINNLIEKRRIRKIGKGRSVKYKEVDK